MNEKQINKWLRKRFSPMGWTLVGYYVLMNILVSVAMLRDVIAGYLNAFIEGNDQYVPDVSALAGNAWGYIAAVAVALVILYAWKGREFWGGEVLRREKPMKPGTLLCMVCLCAGTQMVNFVWINLLELVMNCFGRSATGTLDAVSGSSDTVSMFLYASFLAPISEELIFRGFILRSLRPYGKLFGNGGIGSESHGFRRIFCGGGGNPDRQPCPCPGVHPKRMDRPPVPEMLLPERRRDCPDGSDGNKHGNSAVRMIRTALSFYANIPGNFAITTMATMI